VGEGTPDNVVWLVVIRRKHVPQYDSCSSPLGRPVVESLTDHISRLEIKLREIVLETSAPVIGTIFSA
jgi:hypothetical protein